MITLRRTKVLLIPYAKVQWLNLQAASRKLRAKMRAPNTKPERMNKLALGFKHFRSRSSGHRRSPKIAIRTQTVGINFDLKFNSNIDVLFGGRKAFVPREK